MESQDFDASEVFFIKGSLKRKFTLRARTKVLLLLVAGISVREIFAPFTGHPYDFELWVRLGYYVSKGLDPYVQRPPVPNLSFPVSDNPTWPGYPPLWPLFLALIYKLYAATGIQNRFFYYFLIKQPMIAADVIDAWLIFKLVRTHAGYDKGLKAFAFWLLCPYTILISSIWGMFDQIALLFVLLSIFVISNPWKSSFLEALAIALKLIPAIYLPLFGSVQTSKTKIIIYAGTCVTLAAFFALSAYLYFRSWNLSALEGVGSDVTNKFGNTLNYWEVLYNYWLIKNYSVTPAVEFILRIIGLIWIPIIFLATYFCVRSIRRSKEKFEIILMLGVLFITVVFLLAKTVITEQFVTYLVGFGLFDYYVVSSRVRRILFHGVWISTFVELLINNAFGLAFLEPISAHYAAISDYFIAGPFNETRLLLMSILAVIFTAFSLGYLYSLYKEFKR